MTATATKLPTDPPRPHPSVKDDALYFTDNGAVYCGEHLGSSARYTYRDISGQRIKRVTDEDVAAAATMEPPFVIECETCGKQHGDAAKYAAALAMSPAQLLACKVPAPKRVRARVTE